MTRAHLESLLVGQVVALDCHAHELALQLLEHLDPERVSPAALSVLRLYAGIDGIETLLVTKAQRELNERVGKLTLEELRGHSAIGFTALVELLNALPALARPRTSAMDIGLEDAA